ncbi:hypothetical protein [Parashewanella tropica]|uniref:hypothetical protein n=1 Tax=Parashewanella tropica TaxID=2547970 RepID=UPI00105A30D3|nr:hypothetical protein [Parashewanella tropica]
MASLSAVTETPRLAPSNESPKAIEANFNPKAKETYETLKENWLDEAEFVRLLEQAHKEGNFPFSYDTFKNFPADHQMQLHSDFPTFKLALEQVIGCDCVQYPRCNKPTLLPEQQQDALLWYSHIDAKAVSSMVALFNDQQKSLINAPELQVQINQIGEIAKSLPQTHQASELHSLPVSSANGTDEVSDTFSSLNLTAKQNIKLVIPKLSEGANNYIGTYLELFRYRENDDDKAVEKQPIAPPEYQDKANFLALVSRLNQMSSTDPDFAILQKIVCTSVQKLPTVLDFQSRPDKQELHMYFVELKALVDTVAQR